MTPREIYAALTGDDGPQLEREQGDVNRRLVELLAELAHQVTMRDLMLSGLERRIELLEEDRRC